MSRKVDHFAAVPLRFVHDWHVGDLKSLHVLVGLDLAARCSESRNTADGVAVVALRDLAELCEVGEEAIRRKLHDLRRWGWIDFKPPRTGPRSRWRIWLVELERRDAVAFNSAPDLLPESLRGLGSRERMDLHR